MELILHLGISLDPPRQACRADWDLDHVTAMVACQGKHLPLGFSEIFEVLLMTGTCAVTQLPLGRGTEASTQVSLMERERKEHLFLFSAH